MGKKYGVVVEGRNMPSKFYQEYEEAVLEAKRLTLQERRNAYVVLAITKLEVVDVKVTKLFEHD